MKQDTEHVNGHVDGHTEEVDPPAPKQSDSLKFCQSTRSFSASGWKIVS